MNYAKRMRLCCIVFAALTVLVLRTAVAQAATLQSSAVSNVAESATSAHSETSMPLNEAVAMPPGINQRLVAHSHESGLASPNTAIPNEALFGIAAISSKDVWAVGESLVNSTSPLQTLAEHWNGTNWSVVKSPNVGTSDNVIQRVAAISSSDVWAVGVYRKSGTSPYQTLAEHWNGSSWSVVTSPNVGTSDNYLNGVTAISSTDVWTVGEYHQSGTSPYQTLAEHWNGSSWSVVTSPNVGQSSNAFFSVATISSSDVWAMGYWSQTSTSPAQTLAEHWNGSSWSVVTSPNVGQNTNYFYWVTAISSTDVWTVGGSYATSTSPLQTLTEHWNGTSWSVVTSPDVGAFNNYLNGVVAISSKDVWTTGHYDTSNSSTGPSKTLTEHWNGTAWSVVPSPNFGGSNTVNYLWGLAAISTNDVWTVGDNITSSTNFQAFTEHWNGQIWSIIPPG